MNDITESGPSSARADDTVRCPIVETDLMSSLDETNGYNLSDILLDCQVDACQLRSDENYRGFDNNTGNSWKYPTNYPVRQYQLEIAKVALFKNTLVVLPTGLGKTFLAAVVMYNFYRWYPAGKVVFMAPTRPLVAQQIEACYQIMGISKADTVELTGKQPKRHRAESWSAKRVFYVTPQVLASDLKDDDFPVNDIKLIVVDEAHKAKGKYAYTEVVAAIFSKNKLFRVLALSATPGRRLEDVAEVVQNLLISHIEVRSESSPDVVPYTYKKIIQTVVVKLGSDLKEVKSELINIIDPYVRNLLSLNVLTGSTLSLSKGWLLMQQKKFVEGSSRQRHPQHSAIMSDFAVCMSLYHALELLERHGLRTFLNFFDDPNDKKYFLTRDTDLMRCIDRIRNSIGPNPFLVADTSMPNGIIPEMPSDLDFGHPKFEILRQHLLEHFKQKNDTKSLVFCEFRESVHLIHRLLLQNRPLLKPKVFIGQSAAGGVKAVTQKQQIATMAEFRSGTVNVLIATCVAEEGIDVGEVDLIVCFDTSTKNPTRLVQRIGRTGRRRDGKVLMLVTEGKEQDTLKEVLSTKDLTNCKITRCAQITNLLYKCPRMVPTEFDPYCDQIHIKVEGVVPLTVEGSIQTAAKTKEQRDEPIKAIGKRTKPKDIPAGKCRSQDVRNFFKPKQSNTEATVETESYLDQSSIGPCLDDTVSIDMTNIRPALLLLERVRRNIIAMDKNPFQMLKATQVVSRSSSVPTSLREYTLQHNHDFKPQHLPSKTNSVAADNDRKLFNTKTVLSMFNGRANLQHSLAASRQRVFSEFQDVFSDLEPNATFDYSECLNKSGYKDLIDSDEDQPLAPEICTALPANEADTQVSCNEIESIYSTQNISPPRPNVPLKSSTPFHDNDFMTPLKSTKQLTKSSSKKKSTSYTFQNSPIKQAFQKSFEIQQQHKKSKSRTVLPTDFTSVLTYFKLEKLEDWFEIDTVEERHTVAEVKEDKPTVVVKDVLPQRTGCAPESISIDTQHTISQILDIVNDGKVDLVQTELPNISIQKLRLNEFTDLFDDDTYETSATVDDSLSEIILSSQAPVTNDVLPKSILDHQQSRSRPLPIMPVVRRKSADMFETTIHSASGDSLKENSLPPLENVQSHQKAPPKRATNIINEPSPKSRAYVFGSPIKTTPARVNFEKSPSVLSGRVNLSRLKSQRTLNTNSTQPSEHGLIIANRSESVSSLANDNVQNSLNHKVTPKIDFNSFQYKPATQVIVQSNFDESTIGLVRSRKIKRLTYEDSSSTDDDLQSSITTVVKPLIQRKSKQTNKRVRCAFVLDECDVSGGDESEDEHEGATQSELIADSIICLDEDENDPEEMHAIYLQSIRSPIRRPGAFRISDRRENMLISNVFSQDVPPDTTGYADESFVVSTEDEEALESDKDVCTLEMAEIMLEKRRRRKRKLAKQSCEQDDCARKKRKR